MTAWAQREFTDVAELRGPLLVVRGVTGVGWDEFATIRTAAGELRHGLVLEADRDLAVRAGARGHRGHDGRLPPGSRSAAARCGFPSARTGSAGCATGGASRWTAGRR